jgi:hypothetical protein
VLGGAISFNDRGFLNGMYAAGAGGNFDALSFHPYTQGHAPDWSAPGQEWYSFVLAVPQMAQTMAAHGETDKPIWITEVGWSTDDVSEATRAAYVERAVELVRGWPYVAALCLYALNQQDDGPYGLIAPDGTATATWHAYQEAVNPPAKRLWYQLPSVQASALSIAVIGVAAVLVSRSSGRPAAAEPTGER